MKKIYFKNLPRLVVKLYLSLNLQNRFKILINTVAIHLNKMSKNIFSLIVLNTEHRAVSVITHKNESIILQLNNFQRLNYFKT